MKRKIRITAISKGNLSVTITADLKIEDRSMEQANLLKSRITDDLHKALTESFHVDQIKIR